MRTCDANDRRIGSAVAVRVAGYANPGYVDIGTVTVTASFP